MAEEEQLPGLEDQPPEEPNEFDDLQGDVTGETVTPDFEAREEDDDGDYTG